MTNEEVFDRLLQLAHVPVAGGNVMTAEQLDADSLYELQDVLSQLLVDLANEIQGGAERLTREIPDAFGTRG